MELCQGCTGCSQCLSADALASHHGDMRARRGSSDSCSSSGSDYILRDRTEASETIRKQSYIAAENRQRWSEPDGGEEHREAECLPDTVVDSTTEDMVGTVPGGGPTGPSDADSVAEQSFPPADLSEGFIISAGGRLPSSRGAERGRGRNTSLPGHCGAVVPRRDPSKYLHKKSACSVEEQVHDTVMQPLLKGDATELADQLNTYKDDEQISANIEGGAFLLEAATRGHTECVELLLEKGAHANARDDRQATPLLLAAGHGHKDVLERLLEEQPVDLNAKDKQQWGALLYAIDGGQKDCVRAVLDAGLDSELSGMGTSLVLALLSPWWELSPLSPLNRCK
jgi:hypothetical protein